MRLTQRIIVIGVLVPALRAAAAVAAEPRALLPGFQKAAEFGEQVRWSRLDGGIRVFVDAPAELKAPRRLLVFYATPNGNTIEQTLGCAPAKDLDWRFDIQHVAAQIRRLREIDGTQDVILAVVQAPKLSWPAFRADHADAGRIIAALVSSLARELHTERVVLSGHSGGGSFIFGYLNAAEAIPPLIERIILLDANYAYSDDDRHGDKLLAWLAGDAVRRLVVIAYDDREIVLDGKKVVGPDGGTFRASQRMLARFRRDLELTEQAGGPFRHTRSADGRIEFFIHPNPDNRILHTALVGEMNGLLEGLTLGTEPAGKWGDFGGPRAYTSWIQSGPFVDPALASAAAAKDRKGVREVRLSLPERPADAPTGSAFRERIATLPLAERETAVVGEITRGNVPEFLRRLKPVAVECSDETGARHAGTCFVTCDYLAVGSDEDFFRIPLTPRAALAIADAAGGTLLTAKLSDDVFRAADLKLEPRPLTQDRESVATFFQHHRITEDQLRGKPRGALVAGIKKDIVWTNRLMEKPRKVAIYGWHYPDGRPIQPLHVGHWDRYVDYSHGLRLLAREMVMDGRTVAVADVLRDRRLCGLLTAEGPTDIDRLRRTAEWER